jgi:hypothetical protein
MLVEFVGFFVISIICLNLIHKTKHKYCITEQKLGLLININLLMRTKVLDFKRIITAVKDCKRSSENIAPKIGITPNGLRKAFRNESLTLDTYDKLCRELKLHPLFVWDNSSEPLEYSYKKEPTELNINLSEFRKLNYELNKLKDANMKLQARMIELLEEKKSKK